MTNGDNELLKYISHYVDCYLNKQSNLVFYNNLNGRNLFLVLHLSYRQDLIKRPTVPLSCLVVILIHKHGVVGYVSVCMCVWQSITQKRLYQLG